jgi:hypothetical protein
VTADPSNYIGHKPIRLLQGKRGLPPSISVATYDDNDGSIGAAMAEAPGIGAIRDQLDMMDVASCRAEWAMFNIGLRFRSRISGQL